MVCMILRDRKTKSSCRWNKIAIAVLFFSFSSGLFAQETQGIPLDLLRNSEHTVDSLLEMALDPSRPDYEPEEYVTGEPDPVVLPNTSKSAPEFRPLSDLTISEGQTVADVIRDAEDDLDQYLAAQPAVQDSYVHEMDDVLAGKGSLPKRPPQNDTPQDSVLPASPLSNLLADKTQSVAHAETDVVISGSDDAIKVSVPSIQAAVGENVPISLGEGVGVFVRDNKIVQWNPKDQVLSALSEGSTEIYLHYENQLTILPVQIGTTSQPLLVAHERTVLSNAAGPMVRLASLDVGSGNRKSKAIAANHSPRLRGHAPSAPSYDSRATDSDAFEFTTDLQIAETQKISFRVVDERTQEKKTYPVQGVHVHLVGTNFSKDGTKLNQVTDSLGMLNNLEVPKSSSFVVSVKDPFQRYRSTVVEVPASSIVDNEPIVIRLIGQDTFEAYTSVIVDGTRDDHASVCASVLGSDNKPLSGAAVSIDVGNSRPYYFNRYGFLDPNATQTSEEGRFCFFDLEPGPFAFYFKKANGEQGAPIPLNLFAGSHLEYRFDLGEEEFVSTALAVAPTAFEMWHGGRITEKEYRSIDFAALTPLGSDTTLAYDGALSTVTGKQIFQGGRAYTLSNSSEFEETLYRISLDSAEETVTPLFPNGFLDYVSAQSNIIRDFNNRGTVLIDHGILDDDGYEDKNIEITLYDQYDRPVGERVSLSTTNSSSAVFFNVPPGLYSVAVKGSDGRSVSNDTALVYTDTLSYVRTGSPLVRVPVEAQVHLPTVSSPASVY